jgi:hypothetical protein
MGTTMQRMTTAVLMAKLSRVNRALGFTETSYNTVGAVQLYSAYSATSVVRVVNDWGGIETLSPMGTKRECALFIDGMLAGLEISK